MISKAHLEALETAAISAATNSYSEYSKFSVGAAILTGSDQIVTGANVENASYGLSNCAERTAIFTAVAAGAREIKAVVVYTPTKKPTTPCGACRQVIREFGKNALCVSICNTDERIERSLGELLPDSFGPNSL